MNETDKNDRQTIQCWLKRIIKMIAWATAFVCLSFSASLSFADALPPEFLGRWMVFSDKSSEDKCDEAEGITVSDKRVDWNHESPCGRIDNVQHGIRADNVIVSMTCVDAEGWITENLDLLGPFGMRKFGSISKLQGKLS